MNVTNSCHAPIVQSQISSTFNKTSTKPFSTTAKEVAIIAAKILAVLSVCVIGVGLTFGLVAAASALTLPPIACTVTTIFINIIGMACTAASAISLTNSIFDKKTSTKPFSTTAKEVAIIAAKSLAVSSVFFIGVGITSGLVIAASALTIPPIASTVTATFITIIGITCSAAAAGALAAIFTLGHYKSKLSHKCYADWPKIRTDSPISLHGKIIKLINNYTILRSKNKNDSFTDERGVCNGLTDLYIQYHLNNQGKEFFKRLNSCLEINLANSKNLDTKKYSELSDKEKEVESLCSQILYLQEQQSKLYLSNNTETSINLLNSNPNDQKIKNYLRYTTDFSGGVNLAAHLGVLILHIDPNVPKCVKLHLPRHVVCFYSDGKQLKYYDPNQKEVIIDLKQDEIKILGSLNIALSKIKQYYETDIDVVGVQLFSNSTIDTKKIGHFLDALSELNQKSKRKLKIITRAAASGHLNVIKKLGDIKSILNTQSTKTLSPLCLAAQNGHVDIVKYLLKNGANIHNKSDCGITPLHSAAIHDHGDIAQLLIDKGINTDSLDKMKNSPLHKAVKYKRYNAAKVLVENGASCKLKNTLGVTPLDIAKIIKDKQMIALLKNPKK